MLLLLKLDLLYWLLFKFGKISTCFFFLLSFFEAKEEHSRTEQIQAGRRDPAPREKPCRMAVTTDYLSLLRTWHLAVRAIK